MTETIAPQEPSILSESGGPAMDTLLARSLEFARDFAQFAGRQGIFAVVYVALGALLEGVGLVLLVPILTIVTETDHRGNGVLNYTLALFDRIGVHTKPGRLMALLAIFVFLMIARAIAVSLRDVTLYRLQNRFVETRRSRITEHLAAARWDIIAKLRHARILQVMNADIMQIGAAARFLIQASVSLIMLISQGALAFYLSPALAAFAYVMLLIAALSMGPALRRSHNLGAFATRTNIALTNSTTQFLGGLKLAVSQNLQDQYVSEFNATLRGLTAQQIAFIRKQTNRHLIVGMTFALVGALVVLVGFAFLNIQPAILMTLMLILTRMNGPATVIQQGLQQFTQGLPAYTQIKDLERELLPAPRLAAQNGATASSAHGAIVFHDVRFRHGDDAGPFMLDGVDLTIPPGAFIGIAGDSGAGKTTLADLLVGLLTPEGGEISVGGKKLDTDTLTAWRNRISYVSQDPFLFHDTVRRNLTWAKSDASEDDLWAALRLAGAEALVRRMEAGLDTVVGERGTLVSGGERQRIALARAMLREPQLLILDEATNAIDVAGEREILGQLANRTPRPTIIMIAHRSESLALCERILVLADGRLTEQSADRSV